MRFIPTLALTATAVVVGVLMARNPTVPVARPIASDTHPPVTLRYVKTGEFNNGGHISNGTILWPTNHTGRTISLTLSEVEVKTSLGWTQTRPLQPLSFAAPGRGTRSAFVAASWCGIRLR